MSGYRVLLAVLSALLLMTPPSVAAPNATLQVEDLRVDNVVNPLAASATPTLSWKLRSRTPGERQTAYRILVASSPQLLARNRADVWDSGRVDGADSVAVPYRGPATKQRSYWTVEVWGARGGPPTKAAPAWWETGADWSGAQ